MREDCGLPVGSGMNLKNHQIILSTILIVTLLAQVPQANAGIIFLSNAPENSFTAENIRYDHDLRGMQIEVQDSNPDLAIIHVLFNSSISPTTFSGSSTTLRVKLLNSLSNYKGNYGNIWIDAPKNPYQGTVKIPAAASAYASPNSGPNDARKNMSECNPRTWMDSVPGGNMVSFEISRNCFDLNNQFFAVAFVETDIYNDSTIKDFEYFPSEPYFNDMTSIPRPIKKKAQRITAYAGSSEYTLDTTSIPIITTNDSGRPINLTSKTPTVCAINNNTVVPKNIGTCQVTANSPETDVFSASNVIEIAFSILPKKVIPKVSQQLYFNEPGEVYEGDSLFDLDVSSDSGLRVEVRSTSQSVCEFPYGDYQVQVYQAGTCSFYVTQPGNDRYLPASGSASFEVYSLEEVSGPNPPPKKKSVAPPKKKIEIAGSASTSGGGGSSTSATKGTDATSSVKKVVKITCKKKGFKNVVVTKLPCPKGFKK
jgi:hypothetical protein